MLKMQIIERNSRTARPTVGLELGRELEATSDARAFIQFVLTQRVSLKFSSKGLFSRMIDSKSHRNLFKFHFYEELGRVFTKQAFYDPSP